MLRLGQHWPVATVGRISLYLGMNTVTILGLFKERGALWYKKLAKLKEATAFVVLVLGQYDLGNSLHFHLVVGQASVSLDLLKDFKWFYDPF